MSLTIKKDAEFLFHDVRKLKYLKFVNTDSYDKVLDNVRLFKSLARNKTIDLIEISDLSELSKFLKEVKIVGCVIKFKPENLSQILAKHFSHLIEFTFEVKEITLDKSNDPFKTFKNL